MSNRRPKGTGSIRERNGQVQATYSFVDHTGKRRRRSAMFPTRTAAREWLAGQAGAPTTAHAGGITVGEFLADWLDSLGLADLEAGTVSWYRSAVEKHITPAIGGIRLSRLSAVQVEAFLASKMTGGRLDGKPGGLGPASVRRLQVTLGKALDAAVRKGLLAVNPVRLAEKPKTVRSDVTEDVWPPETVGVFLRATVDDREHPVWHVAAMTGLRRSELAGLQWGDLDLDAGVLSVKRARTQVDGKPVVKGPKSATSRRLVDLDTETVNVLRRWKVSQLEERMRAGSAWAPGEWVFTNQIGQPWRPDAITRTFVSRVADLGLPRTDIKGLRHAHATALLAAGVHPKIVQERLGHSSIAVTMDIYSSVLPGMQREAVERLSALMSGR